MRILHTEWSDGWGGQEKRIYTEMLGMRARGHHLALATRSCCTLGKKLAEVGFPVVHLPFSGKFDLFSVARLHRLIRAEQYELVNTHSGIDSWVGGMAARLAGVGLVRTRHLNLPLKRSWHNFVHYLPQRVVTCGQTMRDRLHHENGFPAAQLCSIPTGIDFGSFVARRERALTRQALGLAESRFVVLMVAVLRSVKGHDIALHAFARFLAEVPDACLLLAGDGPLRQVMGELADQLGIGAAVRFLDHRDDIPDLLAAADCLLLTSRSEGIPQAVTQALGLGLPVVASAVGGVPELVIDGQTGLLVPAGDPSATAQALARLAADPALRQRLGAAGRQHARAHYSLGAMLDQSEALFAQVIEEAAR